MPKNRFKFPCARRFRWNRSSTYYPKLSHFILLFARQIVKTCTMMEYRLVSYRITNPIRRFPRDRLPIPSYDFYGGSFEKKLNGNRSRKCLWETLGEEKLDQRWFPLFVRFRGVLLWLKNRLVALSSFKRLKYRVSNDFRALFFFSLSIDMGQIYRLPFISVTKCFTWKFRVNTVLWSLFFFYTLLTNKIYVWI